MSIMQEFKQKLTDRRERRRVYDQKYEQNRMKNRNQLTKSSTEKTLCICPKCGETHYLDILWTGRGIPRKYHHLCKSANSRISAGTIPEHSQGII